MDFYSILLHILLSNSTIVRWDTGPQKESKARRLSLQRADMNLSVFHHNRQRILTIIKTSERLHKTNRRYRKLHVNSVILTLMHQLVLFCEFLLMPEHKKQLENNYYLYNGIIRDNKFYRQVRLLDATGTIKYIEENIQNMI